MMIWTLLLIMSTTTMATIPVGETYADRHLCLKAAMALLTAEATIRAYCVNGETGEVIRVPVVEDLQ